jgi:hypothetical protein
MLHESSTAFIFLYDTLIIPDSTFIYHPLQLNGWGIAAALPMNRKNGMGMPLMRSGINRKWKVWDIIILC